MVESMITPPEIPSEPQATILPSPLASPEVVSHWLRRLRVGAILGLSYCLLWIVYAVLWNLRIIQSPKIGMIISYFINAVGVVGVWLLVSPEPENQRWLRLVRWTLRPAAVAFAAVCGISMVVYGSAASLSQQPQIDSPAQTLVTCGVLGLWLLLYQYLRTLSQRLGDKTLRSHFTILVGLNTILIIFFLVALSLRYIGRSNNSMHKPLASTAAVEQRTISTGVRIVAFSLYAAYFGWMAWLMRRLSTRLDEAARNYQRISVIIGQLPNHVERPE
jgi:hypothetical protein